MRTKGKKLLGILLSLVLVVGMLPAMSITVHADQPAVKYLDEDGVERTCTNYTIVTQDMGTQWAGGWYYVNAIVTFNSEINPRGDVHIILGDNAKISHNKGLSCLNNLSIYAQSAGENMGTLEATLQDNTAIFASGTITIAGGNIIAKAANTTNGSFGIFTQENLLI